MYTLHLARRSAVAAAVGLLAAIARLHAGDFYAGAAQVEITPPPGVPMAGYYHARAASGVHDPLYAKALVLDSDGELAALVVLDLISTTRDLVQRSRAEIQASTGIRPERILVSATHAHTGPVLRRDSARDAASGSESDLALDYLRALPALIAQSVSEAVGRLEPVRVRAASGREPTLAFNRRFHMTDGGFGWNPGKLNPRILRPAGPIDPEVPVVTFERPDGGTLATYVNYAMHLDTVGGLEISADYPYTLARSLAAIHGHDAVTLFTIGCAGDTNHVDVSWKAPQKGHAEAARIGTVLAGAVVETFPRLGEVGADGVRCRSAMVELDLPPLSEADVAAAKATLERGRDDRQVPFLELVQAYKVMDVARREGRPHAVEVQVIALGRDVAWVGLPGEIFVELGIALKAASPFERTIVVELANGSVGYVPTRQAYTQGQYEVISARVAAGSGERLVEAAARLLRELFSEASAASKAAVTPR